MWLFFRDSFLSVVAHRDNNEMLLVRARFQGDIERIFRRAEVTATPQADYAFRAVIPRTLVAAALTDEIMVLDYHNVKNAVDETFRHDVMMDIWGIMSQAQRKRLNEPFE